MLKTLNHNIILPKYFGIVKKKGSSLLFSAQGGRGKEKNYKPAEKNFASPSEGAAEGGFKGGIPPRPSVPPSEARRYQFPPKKFRAKFRISHTLKKESVVRRPFFLCGDGGNRGLPLSVRNNFLAVARKFSRPWLGYFACWRNYASAFRFPHAECADTLLTSTQKTKST